MYIHMLGYVLPLLHWWYTILKWFCVAVCNCKRCATVSKIMWHHATVCFVVPAGGRRWMSILTGLAVCRYFWNMLVWTFWWCSFNFMKGVKKRQNSIFNDLQCAEQWQSDSGTSLQAIDNVVTFFWGIATLPWGECSADSCLFFPNTS